LRQTTNPKEHAWLARCRYDSCEAAKRKCPVCKKPGHITTHVIDYKNGEIITAICFQHAHFLENVDAGRNMFCETEYLEPIQLKNVRLSYRLIPSEKERLIEKYNGILK
jgi:predicted urease superfamily metal-dependent hydrolase